MTALCAALILMGGFSVPAYAQGTAAEPPTEDATNDSNVVVEEPETPPLTPKGNATLVDDFGGNKQLITVTTKGGNYFYGNTAQKSRRDTARSDIIRPWINR